MSKVLQFKTTTRKSSHRHPVWNTLTVEEQDVWDILNSESRNVVYLSEMFDVSNQTIRNIKLLKTKRAERICDLMRENGVMVDLWTPAVRFTPEEVAAIRASQKNSVQLGKLFECSPSTIRMLKTGKTYNG